MRENASSESTNISAIELKDSYFLMTATEGIKDGAAADTWEQNEAAVTGPHSQDLKMLFQPVMVQTAIDNSISKDWKDIPMAMGRAH